MVDHVFGGDWTEVKLGLLAKYLAAYRQVFTRNAKAGFFRTWYVDAFAGTGSRTAGDSGAIGGGIFDEVYEDAETSQYKDGSARIALGLQSPFHKYLFIEQSSSRAGELRDCIEKDFPELLDRCELKNDDANKVLRSWCKERDWSKERAVVFLDPYGMQVEWGTIEALAATKGVDLWYLFPLGVARMLTLDGKIDESWRKRLDTLFGTNEWSNRFYQTKVRTGLFGEFEELVRDATVENIQGFIKERLGMLFTAVANSRVLRNSKSSPLFALCFAASNEKGAPTALKIAQGILGKSEGKLEASMATTSNIEWTEMTWNPVTGCQKVSQGCKHCYAERMAKRLNAMGSDRYRDGFAPTLHYDLLDTPRGWKKPRIIFVNSMSDLFQDAVPDDFIRRVFTTMQDCPQHTFQVLTKRSERLRTLGASLPWPKNVWMGVSVESNEVIHRVRDLASVPAHVRFLSCEPLIGPLSKLPLKAIHWVIVGGESGPGARPMNPEWVESIQRQCNRSKALFFFKQWGGVRKDMTGRALHGRTYDDMPALQRSSVKTVLFPQLA